MKRFRLNLALLVAAIVAATAAAAWFFLHGEEPWGILFVIVCLTAIAGLYRLVRRLIHVTGSFMSALEAKDSTMHISIGDDDREMREMSAAMNRIMKIYRSNCLELETRKLYYDRILRIMTHEMRNSITPVISIVSDMEKHPEKYSGEMGEEALRVVKAQSTGIKHFLDSYHRLTHLPAPCKKTVDVAHFMEGIQTLGVLELERRGVPGDVLGFTTPENMQFTIDEDLMRQVLVNLLRNAMDAVAGVAAPRIVVTVSKSEGMPCITVEDNGAGIPDEVRENLFQPFFTTKPDGTGIGLCLSRQIVRLHGGDMSIGGAVRHGTSVVITLPDK